MVAVWPRFLHDFPKIAERGMGINGALYLGPKIGKGCRNFGLFIRTLIAGGNDAEVCHEIGYGHPRFGAKKRATWIGGGLAKISPRFPENCGTRIGD